MPIAQNTNRNRYQEGSLERVSRSKGPDVWVYRWRELNADGHRVQRKRVIGTIDKYKTLSAAKRASDNLRLAVNAPDVNDLTRIANVTLGQAWGHFSQTSCVIPRQTAPRALAKSMRRISVA